MPIELIAIIAILAFVYWLSSSSDGALAAMHKLLVWTEKYVFFFDPLLRKRRKKHEALAASESLPAKQRERHATAARRAKHALSAIYSVIATICLAFLAWIKLESWIGWVQYYFP